MYYTGLKVGVIYQHAQWAQRWRNEFVTKYIEAISRSTSNVITLMDDTTIRFIRYGAFACGTRFDKIFVEPGIDIDGLESYISPMYQPYALIDDGGQDERAIQSNS